MWLLCNFIIPQAYGFMLLDLIFMIIRISDVCFELLRSGRPIIIDQNLLFLTHTEIFGGLLEIFRRSIALNLLSNELFLRKDGISIT